MFKLPPLNSLPVFVAAAKHQSFTNAATQLHVTQGAVSKQIALLEDYLGISLFERNHQSLQLTKLGKEFLKNISPALTEIEKSAQKLTKKSDKEIIRINILPSLSNQWLVPRLSSFKALFPEYKVDIETGNDDIDFNAVETDIAIRISKKSRWKNLNAEKLFEEKLLCVCSPKLRKKFPLKQAKDLLKYNLLLHSSRPNAWIDYLKSQKVKTTALHHDISFERFFMIIKAAKDGLGFALLPEFLIKKELENGELKIALKPEFRSGYNYYLIHPKQKSHLQKITDFKIWLKASLPKKTSTLS